MFRKTYNVWEAFNISTRLINDMCENIVDATQQVLLPVNGVGFFYIEVIWSL